MTKKTARAIVVFVLATLAAAIPMRLAAPELHPEPAGRESRAPVSPAPDDSWWLEPPNAPVMPESSR